MWFLWRTTTARVTERATCEAREHAGYPQIGEGGASQLDATGVLS